MKILKIAITIFLYVKFYRYENGKGKKKNSGEYIVVTLAIIHNKGVNFLKFT